MTIVVPADPAPYNLPPLPFSKRKVLLVRSYLDAVQGVGDAYWLLIRPLDSPAVLDQHAPDVALQHWTISGSGWRETPISWAHKPFSLEIP
jgi:hypothetical protein